MEALLKIKAEMLKYSRFMLIQQQARARCRYIISPTQSAYQTWKSFTELLTQWFSAVWLPAPVQLVGVWQALVGPILMIFSFYNSLIRWARVGWCVVLEPTWYWEQDLQSVRSCQAKPHFTGQLPGTIAINFVYVSLYRLLFLQIISKQFPVLSSARPAAC